MLAGRGIKQITPNAPVTTQAAANVRDNFETGSFANNDGTHRWYGDWVEQNDNNSPYGGKVTIGWHERGGNRLILGGNGAIYRRAATPVELSLASRSSSSSSRVGLEAGEYVAVQASANGGTTWTEVGRISGAGQRHRASPARATTSPPIAAATPRSVSSRSMNGAFRRRLRRHRRRRDRLHHQLTAKAIPCPST